MAFKCLSLNRIEPVQIMNPSHSISLAAHTMAEIRLHINNSIITQLIKSDWTNNVMISLNTQNDYYFIKKLKVYYIVYTQIAIITIQKMRILSLKIILLSYPKNKVYCKSFLPPSLPCESKPTSSFFSPIVYKLHIHATTLNNTLTSILIMKHGPNNPTT